MNSSKTDPMINDDEDDRAAAAEDDEEASDAWVPNFHWLTDQLAVGGRFPLERAAELARVHGIRAVVDLRAEECDDEAALRGAGIVLLHLPTPDMEPARPEHLDAGVTFVREHLECGEKVLIHCQHGIGRSALLALCVLVDRGWQPLDALVHAKDQREIVSPSRSQYDGWAAWLRSRGLNAPDYHTFGCIAYRRPGTG
jgi:protein-tyrosine phosphatase